MLGRYPDGSHRVRTTLQAISVHDLLLVEPAAETSLEGGFPDDLVLRAQRALEMAAGRALPARMRLWKRIPPGAGLGGGSSDAAAALRALARLHSLACDLSGIAARLGADVAFFLQGGAAVAEGRGERLHPIPVRHQWYALAWPGFQLSTAAVYRAWDWVGGDGDNQLLRAALEVEPRLKAFAERLGPDWRMTGSGSAFFLACPDRAQAERALAGVEAPWRAIARPLPAWGAA